MADKPKQTFEPELPDIEKKIPHPNDEKPPELQPTDDPRAEKKPGTKSKLPSGAMITGRTSASTPHGEGGNGTDTH